MTEMAEPEPANETPQPLRDLQAALDLIRRATVTVMCAEADRTRISTALAGEPLLKVQASALVEPGTMYVMRDAPRLGREAGVAVDQGVAQRLQ